MLFSSSQFLYDLVARLPPIIHHVQNRESGFSDESGVRLGLSLDLGSDLNRKTDFRLPNWVSRTPKSSGFVYEPYFPAIMPWTYKILLCVSWPFLSMIPMLTISFTVSLQSLSWKKLDVQRKSKTATVVYKSLDGSCPWIPEINVHWP